MCQQWLTTSTLGDLSARLDGIRLVICIIRLRPEYADSDEKLISELQSLIGYYSLFTKPVTSRSQSLTAPIRKELDVRILCVVLNFLYFR